MHPGELPSGPASSHATWSAANSLIDQNAALWASLRPPPRPSWPVLVRQRVSELSLAAVGERLHVGLPRWFGTRETAQRWLLSATAGIVLGLGLGVAGRLSESAPPEQAEPPIAVQPVAAPPVPVQLAARVASPAPSAAVEDAPASPTPELAPNIEADAPRLARSHPRQARRGLEEKEKGQGNLQAP